MLERIKRAINASGVVATAIAGNILCANVSNLATGSICSLNANMYCNIVVKIKLGTEIPSTDYIMAALSINLLWYIAVNTLKYTPTFNARNFTSNTKLIEYGYL